MNCWTYKIRFILFFSTAIFPSVSVYAQEWATPKWGLNRCIEFALEQNIQVKAQKLSVSSQKVGLAKSKSERLPSLNASVSENIANSKDLSGDNNWEVSSGTSFSLSSSLTLYSGGSISKGIRQSEMNMELANSDVETTQNNIILSITQAYLNVLYANESSLYAREVLTVSEKQAERTRELFKVGSVTKLDVAKMDAQRASDKYSVVTAENTLISRITELKQLLEIPVTNTFNVYFPEVIIDGIIDTLPVLTDVYSTALSIMPEIKSGQLSVDIAEVDVQIAQAGYLPTLTMSAGYSTDYSDQAGGNFGHQLSDNQSQHAGFTLSIPIFSRNVTKASVQQSKIKLEQARLSKLEAEKNLLQEVESVFQDSRASINRYRAAVEQMASANETYRLSEEQFNLGILNTVELLEAKTTFLNARAEYTQAKYSAILNRKILDFYMGNPIFKV